MLQTCAGFSSTRCAGWNKTKWPTSRHRDRVGTRQALPHFREPRGSAAPHAPGLPARRTPGCRLLPSRRTSAIPFAGRIFRLSTRSSCPRATRAPPRCRRGSVRCKSSVTRNGSTISAEVSRPCSKVASRSTIFAAIRSHHRYPSKHPVAPRRGGPYSCWRTIIPTTASAVGTERRRCMPQSLTEAAMRSGRERAISMT